MLNIILLSNLVQLRTHLNLYVDLVYVLINHVIIETICALACHTGTVCKKASDDCQILIENRLISSRFILPLPDKFLSQACAFFAERNKKIVLI